MTRAAPATFQDTMRVRDACLCLHAQRAARALARRFDDALRPAGITSGQFSLLNALNRPAAPTIGTVADFLAMDRTTLTANLKPLERDGLLRIEVDPDDRRGRRLRLTARGRAALARGLPIWTRVHDEIEQGLADADLLRAGMNLLGRVAD